MATSLIDESVLADAREVDRYLAGQGESVPSLENPLRLIKDIDADALRRIARDVWGTGGEEGADLVGTSFSGCVDQLNEANKQTSAWTGDANNAYARRESARIRSRGIRGEDGGSPEQDPRKPGTSAVQRVQGRFA